MAHPSSTVHQPISLTIDSSPPNAYTLLWVAYLNPALTTLNHNALSQRRWNVEIVR